MRIGGDGVASYGHTLADQRSLTNEPFRKIRGLEEERSIRLRRYDLLAGKCRQGSGASRD